MIINFIVIFLGTLFLASSNYVKKVWVKYAITIIGMSFLTLYLQKKFVSLSLMQISIHLLFMLTSTVLVLYLIQLTAKD
ncbi:Uncharacterised protein [Psychrobacter phenylpyruvicus]|uniref:Uncharacterized protein n=1 Tax=Psychrobacter phenylpyruvicus TaxID=29432 RepID=A0A379LR17_9GAMM|nr:Uncharacterised protein [Psychrobacter phenylpyruvicus]